MWYKLQQQMATHSNHHIAQIVGANIRRQRLSFDWTQKDLGDRLGVRDRDVSRWENGVVEPGPKYRYMLALELFGGDVSALYREPMKEAA